MRNSANQGRLWLLALGALGGLLAGVALEPALAQVPARVVQPLPPSTASDPLPASDAPRALFESSDFSFVTAASFQEAPPSGAARQPNAVRAAAGYQPPEGLSDPNYQSAPGSEPEYIPATPAYRTYEYFRQ
jgi:hypothetical protein